jgi:tetratricopeptide (TPR) repeat protein
MGRLTFGVLLLTTPVTVTAYAQNAEQEAAKALYTNGKMLFDEGRFNEALMAWREAYTLSNRPLLLYNIALAQTELAQFKDAIESLYQYRIYAPKDQQQEIVQQIAALKEALAEQERLQAIENDTVEKGAPAKAITPSKTAAKPPPTKPKRAAAIAMWSGSALLATGGAVFAVLSAQNGATYEKHCGNLDGLTLCTGQAEQHYYDQQQQFAILADASWGLSLASGGVALWLTLRKPKTGQTQHAKGAAFVIEPHRIQIKGRF